MAIWARCYLGHNVTTRPRRQPHHTYTHAHEAVQTGTESTTALDISAEAVNASVYPCPDLTCQATKAISDTSPLRSSARFTGRVG